jgi:hypothetical protein
MTTIDAAGIAAARAAYNSLHAQIAGYRCTRGEFADQIRRQGYAALGAWFGQAADGRLVRGDQPENLAAHAAIATSLMAEFERRAAGRDDSPAAPPPVIRFCGFCDGYTRCGHEPPVTGPAAGGLPDTIQVLWTPAHPHPRAGAPPGGEPSDAEQAKILAALSLATRASLRIQADRAGDLVVLAEEAAEEEDEAATWIVGLALHDPRDGWYLGCVTCKDQIEESDSGMCLPCRRDAAADDAEQPAAAQAGW